MLDLMFKADDEMSWNAFAATFPSAAEILIDVIGPIVITPAVIDPDGQIITPAVVDPAYHVNIRVQRPIIQSDDEEPVSIDVCAELALGGPGVEWIDPADVSSPERIWAGGMNYWVPGQVE